MTRERNLFAVYDLLFKNRLNQGIRLEPIISQWLGVFAGIVVIEAPRRNEFL